LSGSGADFQPSNWLRFIHLDPFTRKWSKLGLNDEALRSLEVAILTTRDLAPVIKGTGGLRKLRFSPPGLNRGKRETFRVCYTLFPVHGVVALVTVYAKNEKADLSPDDRKAIAQVIREIQEQFDRGVIR
jgi:mRNA-degrading endonuclease RelE of RelBE toxin-antitoxin system